MHNFPLQILIALAAVLALFSPGTGHAALQLTTPAESTPALELFESAMKSQDAGDYQTAAEQWTQLLDEFKDNPVANKAHLNAGLCHTRLKNFEQSIFHFKAGLKLVSSDSADEVPQALLYLGYSQLELGRSLLGTPPEALGEVDMAQRKLDANAQLTTATQTLGRLLNRFPDFEGLDQAAFFQGEAYAALDRLKDAATSYETMLTFEKPMFAADGRFALANVNQKLGRYEAALAQYDLLLAEAKRAEDSSDSAATPAAQSLLTETAFRSAELLMRMADADHDQGEFDLAAKQYMSAYERYQVVLEDKASNQLNRRIVPAAIYGAAWSQLQIASQDSSESSAKPALLAERLFTQLIKDYPDHPLVADAKTGRGSARRLAGELQDSVTDLKEAAATATDPIGQEETQLELGLAHVQLKEWERAIKVFEQLVADHPDSTRSDRYRYELAWVLKSLDKPRNDLALEQLVSILDETPDSPFAAEAHFHLASAAYANEDYPVATQHYARVVDSKLPAAIRESSRYQLAWSEYRLGNFDVASEQFALQIDEFPTGQLSADGKFMFAESQFRQDKHADALQAYLVAKPAVDANGNVDPKVRMLTMLHGAKSANESGNFAEAIKLATPITRLTDVDPAYQQDAWLEIGVARAGQGTEKSAMDAWQQALPNLGLTGARARCLLGDALSKQGDFTPALNQFKLVYYGFGGIKSESEIRPWQAYALYESARLNQKLCADANADLQRQLIGNAMAQYELLLEHYDDSSLVAEAEKQLAKLKQY